MLFFVVLLFLGTARALAPTHLKPGALSAHLGRAYLVEDVLWVQYPFPSLVDIPDNLRNVAAQLTAQISQIRQAVPQQPPHLAFHSVLLFADRLSYINDSLNIALENFGGLPAANRTKRGFINGLGYLSRMLFGTAMDEDVVELRDRYNQLLTHASTQDKIIKIHSQHITQLEKQVNDITSYTTLLASTIDKLLANFRHITLFQQTLDALETAVNTLFRTNTQIIQNLVDASTNRVTSSLFPVKDFRRVLDLAATRYKLSPVFDLPDIHHYYPLLESFITDTGIIIHIPFKSGDSFEVYHIEPFPFSINGTIMTLDRPSSVVLIHTGFSLYASDRFSALHSCRTEHAGLYFCSASTFAFMPLTGNVCEAHLTHPDGSKALAICPYRQLTPQPLFHTQFSGFHYFFFTNPYFTSIVCPDGTTHQEVLGHLAVRVVCFLRSANLTTFPEKLHEGFRSSFNATLFPLDSLANLNFTSIKYVTHTLSEFHLSNYSQLQSAVQDSLPTYLSPGVHYPTLLIPVVLIILTVIPISLCLRRALTLYTHLKALHSTQRREAGV